jgi:hypothetical protein
MRLIFGMIIGAALRAGAAYIADAMTGAAKPLVKWDVVVKNVDEVTTLARAGWKRLLVDLSRFAEHVLAPQQAAWRSCGSPPEQPFPTRVGG